VPRFCIEAATRRALPGAAGRCPALPAGAALRCTPARAADLAVGGIAPAAVAYNARVLRAVRRVSACAALAVGLVALPGDAAADRDASDAARVDWAAGWVIAGGTGIADRHAPSPAVALGTSRRSADAAARRRIAEKLAKLPLAGGGTLADRLGDAAVAARIDAAVEAAIGVAAEPETDGSWHVTLAVPLEAIRLALSAPRALAPGGDRGPPVVVVERAAARPAIGWTIAGAAAATLWVADVPAWARGAPRITARSARAGAIDAPATGSPATLYVILIGR